MVYPQNELKQYLLPCEFPSTLELHTVTVPTGCVLYEYVTEILNVDHGFRRGHTYYEFTNKQENIQEGKEVLLQERQNSKRWFRLAPPAKVAAGRLKLYGEGIARSSFGDRYKVFIQSFGSGNRYLPNGSSILYNHNAYQVSN